MGRGRLSLRDTGAFLLAYESRRPFLRVVDVDAGEVFGVPTSLDRLGYALDSVVRRDGFLAFGPNVSTALIPDDLASDGLVVENIGWPAAAVDDGHVWISRYGAREQAQEVDREGNVVSTVTVPPDWWIVGELADAFVVFRTAVGLWRPGHEPVSLAPEAALIAVLAPDRFVVASFDGVRVYDSSGHVTQHVEFGLGGWRHPHAGMSPNGRCLAVDMQSFDVRDWEADRLAYVDLDHGTWTMVAGGFENFCYSPVFSCSGRHVFFGVPFEKRVLGFAVDDLTIVDVALPKKRVTAMPLLDLGELPAAAFTAP